MKKVDHIHFIGICGVAMGALALAFKKIGWKVTGSDVGFYPPVSTHLKDAGVNYYPGWHPEKMVADGAPDVVVVGNVAGSTNPEWVYVQEHKLNYKSYPEVIKEFFVQQKSIVCAGTYGKTTSSALLAWIFSQADYDPSYMFGGLMSGQKGLPSAKISDSEWSVLEGDEYKASRWDSGPKFNYYSPTHLLLTSVVWDHADVYPTEESYFKVFENLIASVASPGITIISEKVDAHLVHGTKAIRYGKTAGNEYVYGNVRETKDGVTFNILHKNKTFSLGIPCLGEYMADNATGCFALAHEIGIEPEKIIRAIQTFPGMKRRLEKRFEGNVTIFDDIAHSPTKAQAVLESLRRMYQKKIIAVFEPNTGNREPQAAPGYKHAFGAADEVVVPMLTKLKQKAGSKLMEGDELAALINETHPHVSYSPDDAELVATLTKKIQPGDVVVFLGSHGFRGMIEKLVEAVQ